MASIYSKYETNKDTADHIQRAEQLARMYRPSIWKLLRSTMQRAVSFAKAITSPLWKKRLTKSQYEARLAACLGCEFLAKTPGAPLGHCNACGCKKNKLAELTVKANLPAASCPRGKWDGSKPIQPANGA